MRPNRFCLLVFALVILPAAAQEKRPMTGPIFNLDCTQLFYTHDLSQGDAGAIIDAYVDSVAAAGVKVFLCNTNARRTNYVSEVWESFWDGCDPTGPDDQPWLAGVPADQAKRWRKLTGSMQACAQQGIDYPARVLERCRHDDMAAWITLRMNDCHNNDNLKHPFHGTFWVEHPEFYRQGASGYYARCLDYAHQEVRDYYRALIAETLDRYDLDGLELDFMREPFLFSVGREAAGRPLLTAWLREVHGLVTAAAQRRGHPIQLGVRVPSRPATALGLGLDALTWARDGLLDLLVVTPRWATVQCDLPLESWRELLGDLPVTLAGGLEVNYRPYPAGPARTITPDLAAGTASMVLSRGADAVYLFNYFPGAVWPTPGYNQTLAAMASLDELAKLPRRVAVTYCEITAPGEDYHPPLPAVGQEVAFVLRPGTVPVREGCVLVLGLVPSASPPPTVKLNGQACDLAGEQTDNPKIRLLTYAVPARAVAADGEQRVTVRGAEGTKLDVRRVELALPAKG